MRRHHYRLGGLLLGAALGATALSAGAEIAATHIWHNHMPNFWPFYDVSKYDQTAVGAPIRYTYDGQVKELKKNPPPGYSFYIPGSGLPMPHDDLEAYYSHHAKKGAYLAWPMETVEQNNVAHPLSQAHVTMSASVINNVQSFAELGNQADYNLGWGNWWRSVFNGRKTTGGKRALDTIHFTGHHSMGPLVGDEYFLKDLIYQNVTLAQPYFLGDSFVSSKGFFPTELGFSTRLIPTLKKLGIEWSVLGNVHYSRTLRDYPYLNDPGKDTLISPPNRSDLRNVSNVGSWVELNMFNEKQVTYNKFPFAAIPHWVEHVDPETGESFRIAGIPVEQASSWEEGYQGSVTAGVLKPFTSIAAAMGRTQMFAIAHDGDNSQGRAGDGGTWKASGNVTYADSGVTGMGIDEYLARHPIPADDVVHVQDGSWIDTRDSSSDPTWYHWRLPFGVWDGQLAAFNTANGTSYPQLFGKYSGRKRSHMVSLEYGYHYLERNFALLQAALNYAKTAEQIWLDANPNHWSPKTALDKQITYPGNQLNPWMLSYPVKGDASKNWAGGANPAELAWYFLIASIDSGFGYYDENVDDGVKPTISFNQSLHFSKPYVEARRSQDRTGPSVWWPQRYPYNPGSANASKAEGWAITYADNVFALYTYAYDLNDIASIKAKVRVHTNKLADAKDKTYKLYDPAAHADDPQVDPSRVGEWVEYELTERDLKPIINGVPWQPSSTATFEVVPAQEIGNLYYVYLDQYRDQLLDYYIEATDSLGNVTRSEIQQVYVGQGNFKKEGGKIVEAADGDMPGEHLFFTDQPIQRDVVVYIEGSRADLGSITVDGQEQGEPWIGKEVSALANAPQYFRTTFSYDDGEEGVLVRYQEAGSNWLPATNGVLLTAGVWTIAADGSVSSGAPDDLSYSSTIFYQSSWSTVCIHWRPAAGVWTSAPGVPMTKVAGTTDWWAFTADLGVIEQAEVTFNNCAGTWDSNGGKNYLLAAGSWKVSNGTISEGTVVGGNLPPVARVTPATATLYVGDSVTLSAAGSTDADGTIVSYSWSTGATTPTITLTPTTAGNQTITVTVTDNKGASSSASASLSTKLKQAPIAVICPVAGPVIVGKPVVLDASCSSDDGTIVRYAWSTGDTGPQLTTQFNSVGTFNIGLEVTDNHELSSGTSVGITVVEGNPFTSQFTKVYYRGTSNAWAATAMTLVADNTWELEVTLNAAASQRFKFDINADWSHNYGDNGANGVADRGGADIALAGLSGQYKVRFNDLTLVYSVTKVGGDDNTFTSVLPSLHYRGTSNGWIATPMTLVANNTWQLVVTLSGNGDSNGAQRFKLDVTGNWSKNYGDNGANGVLDLTGADILVSGSGTYRITVNDQTLAYTVVKEGGDNSFAKTFASLNYRGTSNSWAATPMVLVANNTWRLDLTLSGNGDANGGQRFKLDVTGNWSENYGDNGANKVLDRGGADIAVSGSGSYRIEVNDKTLAYSVTKL